MSLKTGFLVFIFLPFMLMSLSFGKLFVPPVFENLIDVIRIQLEPAHTVPLSPPLTDQPQTPDQNRFWTYFIEDFVLDDLELGQDGLVLVGLKNSDFHFFLLDPEGKEISNQRVLRKKNKDGVHSSLRSGPYTSSGKETRAELALNQSNIVTTVREVMVHMEGIRRVQDKEFLGFNHKLQPLWQNWARTDDGIKYKDAEPAQLLPYGDGFLFVGSDFLQYFSSQGDRQRTHWLNNVPDGHLQKVLIDDQGYIHLFSDSNHRKLEPSGKEIARFSYQAWTEIHSAHITPQGFLISGLRQSGQVAIAELSVDGNLLWETRLPGKSLILQPFDKNTWLAIHTQIALSQKDSKEPLQRSTLRIYQRQEKELVRNQSIVLDESKLPHQIKLWKKHHKLFLTMGLYGGNSFIAHLTPSHPVDEQIAKMKANLEAIYAEDTKK